MKTTKDELLKLLIDDLNFIRNKIPEYIQALKEGLTDPANDIYSISLINDVAGLRSKIEQAIGL
jgi:hypothetical protein